MNKCQGWTGSLLLLCLCSPLSADTLPPEVEDRRAPSAVLFPDYQLYPVNLADPRRITFSAKAQYYSDSTIPDTGRRRLDLKMGGRLGLLHKPISTDLQLGWLLSLDVGFHGVFDLEYSQDNIGWDGHYALMLSYRPTARVAYKLGAYHISSHVGDEYAERTGRQRINYTREELQAGFNLALVDNWQWYVEAGRGYDQRNKLLQKPWRLQTGVQWLPYAAKEQQWYAGLDLSAMEERDWKVDVTVQLGWYIPGKNKRWRVGLEHYDGKAQLGEFFMESERYTSLGIYIDI